MPAPSPSRSVERGTRTARESAENSQALNRSLIYESNLPVHLRRMGPFGPTAGLVEHLFDSMGTVGTFTERGFARCPTMADSFALVMVGGRSRHLERATTGIYWWAVPSWSGALCVRARCTTTGHIDASCASRSPTLPHVGSPARIRVSTAAGDRRQGLRGVGQAGPTAKSCDAPSTALLGNVAMPTSSPRS